MNDDTVEPVDTDLDEHASLSVGDPVLGRSRLLSRQCATCIFRPGNPMYLAPGRLRQLVEQARGAAGYIICHSTLPYYQPGARPAICRGFAERYPTWQLQLMQRLWGFVEVDPPTPPALPAAQPPTDNHHRRS